MIESENVSSEHAADVLDATEARAERRHRPVRHVERRIDDSVVALFRRLLFGKNYVQKQWLERTFEISRYSLTSHCSNFLK